MIKRSLFSLRFQAPPALGSLQPPAPQYPGIWMQSLLVLSTSHIPLQA